MYDYTDAQVISYVDVDFEDDGVVDAFSGRVLNVGQTDGMGVEASTTVAVNEYTTLYYRWATSIPRQRVLKRFAVSMGPVAKALVVKEAASSGLPS